jgi:alkylation response protein AidB-like acyl-CoA dehydrogenase
MLTRPSPFAPPPAEAHWLEKVEALLPAIGATVASDDTDARLPIEHLQALSASGLDAAFLPSAHGGEDLSYATLGAVVRTLAATHPAVATLWLMHLGAAHALVSTSTEESARFFAAELRAGRRFANALSEPVGGRHFLTSHQDAERTGSGWMFRGRKVFVSGSEIADHLYLTVRLDGEPRFVGLSVDDTVSFPPLSETVGMRATRSRTIEFAGTALHPARVCGEPPAAYANLISVAFPFLSVGIAESALDTLTAQVRSRATAGADAAYEGFRGDLGGVVTEVQSARLLAERVTWLADTGSTHAMPAAVEAKLYANEVATRAAALAVRASGGSGYLLRSPIQRIARDAQAGALMAYSVPIARTLVGEWAVEA